MPCTYTGSLEGDRELANSKALTETTQAACEMANLLRRKAAFHLLSKKTTDWIYRHEEIDRIRRPKTKRLR